MTMDYSFRILFLCIFFLIFPMVPLLSDYPEIKQCSPGDPLFRQLQEDISSYYKAASSAHRIPFPPLKLFVYSLKNSPNTDIFSLAAQLNIPYDTIVTLNHLSSPGDMNSIHTLLIPNMPGLFIPEHPVTELEQILVSWRMQTDRSDKMNEWGEKITVFHQHKKEVFFFMPGKKFHPVERTYFLKPVFIFPLPRGRITSSFGKRESPFSGHDEQHKGIDIGVPEGTEVYAVRQGIVTSTGYNELYGNYILIVHDGGYQSFYGHLKDFSIHLDMKVFSGMVIGHVGTTGRSTGPHLHFEIRKNGNPKDPLPLFQK